MDLSAEEAVRDAVAAADTVVPTGGGTHAEVGGPVPSGTPVRAPAGIVAYDPADLTVTAYAGTTVADLAAALGAHGQQCVLDPRDDRATLGGVVAVGLSGHRRLRFGPLRDRVLEVRFVTGDARLVRGGGPTVKNVTGFDLPRLLVGSFGTLGVLTRVILRCEPTTHAAAWWRTGDDPAVVRSRLVAPSTIAWSGDAGTWVLLEGDPDDVAVQARAAGLEASAPPPWPDAPHRGRVSVAPGRLHDVGAALAVLEGVIWLAEWGVGTVHVAAGSEAGLRAARAVAGSCDGWLLREAGAPGLEGFGVPLPNAEVTARVKAAFDPAGKLSPGRLPIPDPAVQREAS
ncbi:MAG TPA: FAD-binding protein [Acidimicrobiia bacterium]